jgi:hypothetical protein
MLDWPAKKNTLITGRSAAFASARGWLQIATVRVAKIRNGQISNRVLIERKFTNLRFEYILRQLAARGSVGEECGLASIMKAKPLVGVNYIFPP